jgi:predicted phosphoribosyltransferase
MRIQVPYAVSQKYIRGAIFAYDAASAALPRMRKPKKLVVAVLVAPTDTLAAMQDEADEVICLEDYEVFGAIGYFYDEFRQVTDQEVSDILARFTFRSGARIYPRAA